MHIPYNMKHHTWTYNAKIKNHNPPQGEIFRFIVHACGSYIFKDLYAINRHNVFFPNSMIMNFYTFHYGTFNVTLEKIWGVKGAFLQWFRMANGIVL
jgi:hypothetical protein